MKQVQLPTVALADDPGMFVPGDWFQVATTGVFYSPVYGEVELTPDDLATMESNFRNVTPKAPTQLMIDYDHLSDDPQKPGDGRAAGWVEDLDLRDGGNSLWVRPKWTTDAARMIAKGEYRYVSPFFVTDYLDKDTGNKVGHTLKAVAITNRPFLEGMAEIPAPAIAASEGAHLVSAGRYRVSFKDVDPAVGGGVDRDKLPDADFAGKARSYPIAKPGDVSDAASSIGRAGPDNFSHEELKRNIIAIAHRKGAAYVAQLPAAWEPGGKAASETVPATRVAKPAAKAAQPRRGTIMANDNKQCTSCGAPKLRDGKAVKWDEELAETPGSITCPHCGAPVKYTAVPSDSGGSDDVDADEGTGDADALEEMSTPPPPPPHAGPPHAGPPAPPAPPKKMDEDVAADDVAAASVPMTPPPTKMREKSGRTMSMAEMSDRLEATEVALKETQAALKHEQETRRKMQNRERIRMAEERLSKALRAGKINAKLLGTPENPGWARSFAYRDLEGFKTWLADAPVMVDMSERGRGAAPAEGQASVAVESDTLAKKFMETHPGVQYGEAMKSVMAENRALADRYDREISNGPEKWANAESDKSSVRNAS